MRGDDSVSSPSSSESVMACSTVMSRFCPDKADEISKFRIERAISSKHVGSLGMSLGLIQCCGNLKENVGIRKIYENIISAHQVQCIIV